MEKRKSLVEETILQIKNLEEAVAENAKGILHSTMKEEINQLVKESLTEQEDMGDEVEDVETDMTSGTPSRVGVGIDFDMDGEYDLTGNLGDDEFEDDEIEDESGMDFEDEDEMGDEEDLEGEEPVIDLTEETNPEEILRVFQLMGPNDEIIVKKSNISESEDELYEFEDDLYEFEDEDEEFEFEDGEGDSDEVRGIIDRVFSSEMDEEDDMMYEFEEEDNEEVVYEIEMEDEDLNEEEEEEESYELDEEYEEEEESYDLDSVMESKSFKAKGNVGKVKKVDFKSNTEGGFKTVKKKANKTMGTGNGKKGFTYKDGENLDGEFKIKPKKTETKEAARTYGNGSKSGRGLRKGITPNRNLNLESVNGNEIKILREKNEEYRKALNVFRDKLNEVAVFNSNLAYATRLFTEHTTTKQEKVNILKRFDSVETIKESKNLYHTIKNELTNTKTQPMNESIERTFNNTPSTGSAVNLIESKTYENPQFLRMKDLMTKLK